MPRLVIHMNDERDIVGIYAEGDEPVVCVLVDEGVDEDAEEGVGELFVSKWSQLTEDFEKSMIEEILAVAAAAEEREKEARRD